MTTSNTTTAPLLSLPAGTTTGTGTVLDNGGSKANHSAIIIIAGTLTAGAVTLETSDDNVNWVSVAANGGAAVTPAGFSTGTGVWGISLTGFPAQYVRAAVTTTLTGSSVTVYVASA